MLCHGWTFRDKKLTLNIHKNEGSWKTASVYEKAWEPKRDLEASALSENFLRGELGDKGGPPPILLFLDPSFIFGTLSQSGTLTDIAKLGDHARVILSPPVVLLAEKLLNFRPSNKISWSVWVVLSSFGIREGGGIRKHQAKNVAIVIVCRIFLGNRSDDME